MKLRHRCKIAFVISMLVAAGVMPNLISVKRGEAAFHFVDLAAIPTVIGSWHMTRQVVQPSSFERSFLNDVLYRIYERPDGKSIALAIAYGADQRQNFSIHVPEGCYRASGYDVTSVGFTRLARPNVVLKQLVAQKDGAVESIQYWIVLDHQVVTNHFERKLKQLYYSLLGARAGGVLVRISSPAPSQWEPPDFGMQNEFISALYGVASPEQKNLLFGAR